MTDRELKDRLLSAMTFLSVVKETGAASLETIDGHIAAIEEAIVRVTEQEGMTPHRQVIFDMAIESLKDPESLRVLAKAFREQGLIFQAIKLETKAESVTVIRAAIATLKPGGENDNG